MQVKPPASRVAIPPPTKHRAVLGQLSDMDLRLLGLCSEIWICGETISKGMRLELIYALSTGIPVRFVEEEELNVRD